MRGRMPRPSVAFDTAQQTYFEGDTGYVDPRHPTARAFVLPKLNHICNRIADIGSVLDVGAGNGTFTYYWRRRAPLVEGLELSRNLIAQSPCKDIIRQGNAYDLPYPDDSFDMVFESNLLHHVAHPLRVLSEMRRVARRYVICVEPNRANPPMFLFSLLLPPERQALRFSRRYMRNMVEQVGCRVLDAFATGMISQHRTPPALHPLLKPFDRRFPLGMYSLTIAEKWENP